MILIRVDSSFQFGTGHVFRCLNFAEILKPLNETIEFVCQDCTGHIIPRIESSGYKVHKVSQGQDLRTIQDLKPRWLIVDHYGLDEKWERQVPSATKIFVIDDLVNRPHFCQVLLDQNYRKLTPDYRSLTPANARILIGPSYTLLRPELAAKPAIKKIPSNPQLLAFFGGSDESGESLKFVRSLSSASTAFRFVIVCLNSQKHLPELQSIQLPPHLKLVIDPPNPTWVDLLSQSHFYIGSGGTVTWERLFLGLPGAVLSVAENQAGPSQDLATMGYQLYWGPAQAFDYSFMFKKLIETFSNPAELEQMALKGQSLVSKLSPELVQEIFA
jgi:UDP-2,4-diacetamido-2,4,6-trideoxy-beta-L-altropyranose hydrolase